MVEIVNKQRKIKFDLPDIREFADKALEKLKESRGRSAVLVFVGDAQMRRLNRDFRGKDRTTDVLSFPFEAEEFEKEIHGLGDVVISVEQAARQAAENSLSLEEEVKQLILHGFIHLCGYDHETDDGEMDQRENELRALLEIDF